MGKNLRQQARSYQNLHNEIVREKYTPLGEMPAVTIKAPVKEKVVYVGTSHQALDLRMKRVWDFITGKNTSILSHE